MKYKTNFGYRFNAVSNRSYTDKFHLASNSENKNDKISQDQGVDMAWTWENTLSYSFKIDDHAADFVIGQSMENGELVKLFLEQMQILFSLVNLIMHI